MMFKILLEGKKIVFQILIIEKCLKSWHPNFQENDNFQNEVYQNLIRVQMKKNIRNTSVINMKKWFD